MENYLLLQFHFFRKLSVIGAGLMGAGIAGVSVDKGLRTVLIDMHDEGLARGLNQIHSNLNDAYKRKKMTMLERDIAMSLVKPSTNYDDLRDCNIAIEAVFEEIGLKHKIIKQVSLWFCLRKSALNFFLKLYGKIFFLKDGKFGRMFVWKLGKKD